jgi:Flp pilus assembly protein TadD
MAQFNIDQAMQVAIRNHKTGKLAEADKIYRQVLSQNPNHPEALHLLGALAAQVGRLDAAIELIRRAIAINPGAAEYHYNLGNILRDKKLLDEAIVEYRQALHLRPNLVEAQSNLGSVLADQGLLDEAIAAFREARRIAPGGVEVYNNLGNALRAKGNYEEAIIAYRETLRLKPDLAEAHNNLGFALSDLGSVEEAIAEFRHAIRIRPDYAEAHNNLSLALLLKGDYAEGLAEYEWRWRWEGFRTARRNFSQPMWDGTELNGQTILLHAEGGLGDTLQFVRYVPIVANRGGKVVLECQAELFRLLQGLPGVEQLVCVHQPLPRFDVYCPLMSLPLVLGTRLESIPGRIPYLGVDARLKETWAKKLGPSDGELRVGLAWSGNPKFKNDRTRSIALSQLAPLAAAPGVTFHSLQKGPGSEQISSVPAGIRLIDHGPDLEDFADTAAIISLMDLVVSTDNSRVNLAGALNVPTWVMLQYMPDWRWLLEREDSPWYPTVRLFRQKSLGDWPEVIQRVVDELEKFHAGFKSSAAGNP